MMIIDVLSTKKLRHRDISKPSQSHVASKREDSDFKLNLFPQLIPNTATNYATFRSIITACCC